MRKHSWNRTGRRLTDLVREGLERKDYPLFVAEGSTEKKLEQIQRNGYLWYCLDRFANIKSPLVVFGHSLGHSDRHIMDAMADNIHLEKVFIGLFGDPDSKENRAIRRTARRMEARRAEIAKRQRKAKSLRITFYDSSTRLGSVRGGR